MLDWKSLAAMSDEELGQRDVAETNLACAAGLPDGPTPAQAAECLDRLNHYARCAAHYTERRMPDFRRRPDVYDHSASIFRVICMIQLLQGQFRVLYNEAKIPEQVPLDAPDIFIHGALLGAGGTCASLPVVYAAVGRRLGYPLKLVAAQAGKYGHLFIRWDDPHGERFNIDANNTGVSSPPDDYYRTGLYAIRPEVEEQGCLLRSMRPREELSGFLVGRGVLLRRLGRRRPAVDALAWAHALQPENRLLKNTLAKTMNDWGDELRKLEPPGYPPMYFTWLPRRYPASVPWETEKNILCLEAWAFILNDPELERAWWAPMRRGEAPRGRPPTAAVIAFTPEYCEVSYRFVPAVSPPPGPPPLAAVR